MKILLLGDSHSVGAYGQGLEADLTAQGHTVVRVARGAATAAHFLGDGWRRLPGVGDWDRARTDSYDVAIVSLGTNDAGSIGPVSVDTLAARIKQLADSIPAVYTFWVGAPAFSANAASTYGGMAAYREKDLNTRAAELWAATAPLFGAYAIDPRPATAPYAPTNEVHLGPAGGRAWADDVAARVMGILSTPAPRVIAPVTMTPPTGSWGSIALGAGLGLVGVLALAAWRRRR